jgi:hypothetical protein
MNGRLRGFSTTLLFLGLWPLLTGCESMRNSVRHNDSHAKETAAKTEHDGEPGSDEVLDVKSSKPRPFFKPSRLSGAMSDEGREIERDLGIH